MTSWKDLERIARGLIEAFSRNFHTGIEETTKILSQDIWHSA
jgi:hypothetical protein